MDGGDTRDEDASTYVMQFMEETCLRLQKANEELINKVKELEAERDRANKSFAMSDGAHTDQPLYNVGKYAWVERPYRNKDTNDRGVLYKKGTIKEIERKTCWLYRVEFDDGQRCGYLDSIKFIEGEPQDHKRKGDFLVHSSTGPYKYSRVSSADSTHGHMNMEE